MLDLDELEGNCGRMTGEHWRKPKLLNLSHFFAGLQKRAENCTFVHFQSDIEGVL